jgi:hypothetical protein
MASFFLPGGGADALKVVIVECLGTPERAVIWLAPLICRMIAQPILEPAAALVKALGRSIHVVNEGHQG